MQEYLGIVLRVSIMYLYAVTVMRLSGKRSIAHLTMLDFTVVTIIGDMFDDVFWAEVPVSQGLVGLTTIVMLQVLLAYLGHRSDWVHRLVTSEKVVVVKNGSLEKEGLRHERTSELEVYAELRELGEDKLEEVREANWEPNGELSLLRKHNYEEAQKQDLDALRELFK